MYSIGGISRVVVEVACFPLSAEKKTVGFFGWGMLAGNSLLSFVLGKNCLGGLSWLESAGIFLPQQDFPGWSFVSGNSLVSRCLVASYLGGVSWVEVPCSAPAPSWNSFFGI